MADSKTITIYDGVASQGTTTPASSGAWSKSITLSAGEHSITAKATDNAGNLSGSSSAYKIRTGETDDPTLPDLTTDSGASSSDNVTNDTTPTISFHTILDYVNSLATAPTDRSVASMVLQRATGSGAYGTIATIINSAFTISTAGTTKKWLYNYTESSALSDGTYNYRVLWKDYNSTSSGYSPVLTITIDSTAPSAPSVTSLTSGDVYIGTSLTISGTAS